MKPKYEEIANHVIQDWYIDKGNLNERICGIDRFLKLLPRREAKFIHQERLISKIDTKPDDPEQISIDSAHGLIKIPEFNTDKEVFLRDLKTEIDDAIRAVGEQVLDGMFKEIDNRITKDSHHFEMSKNDKFCDTLRKASAQSNVKDKKIAVVNPLTENYIAEEAFFSLSTERQSEILKQKEEDNKKHGSIGIDDYTIKTDGGNLDVIPSAFCPLDTMFVLNKKDLEIQYLSEDDKDFVFFKEYEEGVFVTKSFDEAGFEARLEFYGSLIIKEPAIHERITLHSSKVPVLE